VLASDFAWPQCNWRATSLSPVIVATNFINLLEVLSVEAYLVGPFSAGLGSV
jgi:hypothetical protein